jgi:formate dehydrogenase alpha subunit
MRQDTNIKTVTIDGKTLRVKEETTILDAARELGVYIPTLCYLEQVNPLGSCRMCLVEVEGVETPVTACTTPVVEGMQVRTQSGKLTELRKRALELMLADHPLDCPVCDKAGECRLQDLTYEMGIVQKEYTLENSDSRVDIHSPLIERYESRCVRCGRCVSVCYEVQGCGAFTYRDKGYRMHIDTIDGQPLACDFCGQCIMACPVGALINKRFKYQSRAWQLEKTISVCPYCAAGCQVKFDTCSGKVFRIRPAKDQVTGVGKICGRPVFGFEFIHSPGRLTQPLVRKQGQLEPVSWEEALDYTANHLQAVKTASGGAAAAGIGSVRATNEDNYIFQKFFRQVLGSPNLDSYNGLGYSQAMAAVLDTAGRIEPGISKTEIARADLVMIIGCDLAVELPVPSLEVIRAAREGKTRLINALPMENKLDRFAHLKLRCKPGSEIYLLAGLIKLLVETGGVKYKPALEEEKFIRSLQNISLGKISQATGIEGPRLQETARMIGKAGKTCFITGYYLVTQPRVKEAAAALANLAMLRQAAVFIVPEKNNQFGTLAMGVTPQWTVGFKKVEKPHPAVQADKPGQFFSWMMEAVDKGEIRALYLMGANILTQFPDGQRTRQALEKLELLVVQDIFPNGLLDMAHVVLPACTLAEKPGIVMDAWGQAQTINRAIPPPGNARPDWQIIAGISTRMGIPMNYTCAGEITTEIARLWPGYPGNPVYTDQEKPTFYPLDLPAGTGEEKSPYQLLIGPLLHHNGTLSTHAPGLMTLASEGILEMNPEDMAELGVNPGEEVKIRCGERTLPIKVKTSPRQARGVVFLPRHFNGIPARFPAGKLPRAGVRIERC